MDSGMFDLIFVTDRFKSALESEDDISIEFYLQAFREILKFVYMKLFQTIIFSFFTSNCRFFHLMGSIFGFVYSDVKSKIEILEEFRENKDVKEKFETVKKMMVYEQKNELLHKKDYVSGSRTLLRLHRGLGEFFIYMKSLAFNELILLF